MKNKVTVFVVDDHHVVREGILSLIRENKDMTLVGEAANGKEAIARIELLSSPPEVILMDINMPLMDGIECTHEICKKYDNRVKVLALTMVKQSLYIRKILKAGAMGYILKNCDKIELFQAINSVHRGEPYFSRSVSQEVMNEMFKIKTEGKPSLTVKLSKREQEVLDLIVKDLSNREIADKLSISIRTVETHKQNLVSKTMTNNVAGLVVYAIKNHLVDIS